MKREYVGRDELVTDINFLQHPERWQLMFVPVKERNTEGRTLRLLGVYLGLKDGKYIVYLCNMYDMPKTPEGWDKLQKREYDSVESMAQDWKID